MKKTIIQILILVLVLVLVLFLTSIKNIFTEQNKDPNIPEKIVQIYSGVLPCADCEGIQTQISFVRETYSKENAGTYSLTEFYLGKSELPISTEGRWQAKILPNGQTKIYINRNNQSLNFLLEPKSILMLDQGGNIIDSKLNYRLQRI